MFETINGLAPGYLKKLLLVFRTFWHGQTNYVYFLYAQNMFFLSINYTTNGIYTKDNNISSELKKELASSSIALLQST